MTMGSLETIFDLKKRIHRRGMVSTKRQLLFFCGYLLEDDTVIVEKLVENGENTFTLIQPIGDDARGLDKIKNLTFLVTGDQHSLKAIPVKADDKVSLKSKTFGILDMVESDSLGLRRYSIHDQV